MRHSRLVGLRSAGFGWALFGARVIPSAVLYTYVPRSGSFGSVTSVAPHISFGPARNPVPQVNV